MPSETTRELLRRLPGVDVLLQTEAMVEALARHPRSLVLESIRQVLDAKRSRILAHPDVAAAVSLELPRLTELILERLEEMSDYTLRTVVNATGIVVHTNLGRSLLADEAMNRLDEVCRRYNNLEYDLEHGKRGSRYVHAEAILKELTGAEGALVVNNNAGAVFLALNTLASGSEVVVSRGQLVEIGGSFRIPDVMRSSGAILVEVGCTNRTHPRDYEAAITEDTALLLKVHTSNYRIIGFSSEVSLPELVEIGQRRDVPVMEDLGSGSFVDFSRFGLPGEPTVQDAVRSGADIVTFSGDKLLGGPQAGIILGKKELIERCKKNPLTRAFRVDKMTLAALEATLRLYRDEREATAQIPTLRMIALPMEAAEERAQELASLIRKTAPQGAMKVTVMPSHSQVGGGSLPGRDLPTRVVAVESPAMSAQKIEAMLRCGKPPIIGRIEAGLFLMDVRTLHPQEFPIIQEAFARLFGNIQETL